MSAKKRVFLGGGEKLKRETMWKIQGKKVLKGVVARRLTRGGRLESNEETGDDDDIAAPSTND